VELPREQTPRETQGRGRPIAHPSWTNAPTLFSGSGCMLELRSSRSLWRARGRPFSGGQVYLSPCRGAGVRHAGANASSEAVDHSVLSRRDGHAYRYMAAYVAPRASWARDSWRTRRASLTPSHAWVCSFQAVGNSFSKKSRFDRPRGWVSRVRNLLTPPGAQPGSPLSAILPRPSLRVPSLISCAGGTSHAASRREAEDKGLWGRGERGGFLDGSMQGCGEGFRFRPSGAELRVQRIPPALGRPRGMGARSSPTNQPAHVPRPQHTGARIRRAPHLKGTCCSRPPRRAGRVLIPSREHRGGSVVLRRRLRRGLSQAGVMPSWQCGICYGEPLPSRSRPPTQAGARSRPDRPRPPRARRVY